MNSSAEQHIDDRQPSLKLKTARTIKWNSIDRISSQILYAIVGVVLANLLSKEDFGLVGAILVFQAFAIIFVDSGFGAALLQKKSPDEKDYSTVFWFNLIVSLIIYLILWFAAPIIAEIFQGDKRLIPLSRVMFISFVINGLGIIQTNRLMKQMNARMIAVSNLIGLIISGIIGITLALEGFGAWSLVWQTISLATIKTSWLWIVGKWIPKRCFNRDSLRQIFRVGMGVFSSSFLNTLFQNIYSFVIGAYYNLASLGIYTQADKWSKMGSASISQILTASFVPVLSQYQDDATKFKQLIRRINRFTAFILFPFMGGLVVMAEPLFHSLFGTKWDAAIILFQILLIRGIFVVLISLYNNYLLALGHARSMVIIEFVKDFMTIAAIFATIFFGSIEILVWGQLAASVLTFLFVLWITSRNTGYRKRSFLNDNTVFVLLTLVIMFILSFAFMLGLNAPLTLIIQAITGVLLYYVVLKAFKSPILSESMAYIFGRFRKH